MNSALFNNREEAALTLAEKLKKYKNKNCVVLAIPRGGVPLGKIIAETLNCPLDLLFTKKIGHPFNKEFAVGAVSLYGFTVNPTATDISASYLNNQAEEILNKLKEKKKILCGERASLSLKNKIVIVVDDGIATGQTILAALPHLRETGAAKIIVAVPVAPLDISSSIVSLTDNYICLYEAPTFNSIGAFYKDFSQVSDEEVKTIMKNH
jgi:putative phosphoribosyl transferase